jgi:hypothetical protein
VLNPFRKTIELVLREFKSWRCMLLPVFNKKKIFFFKSLLIYTLYYTPSFASEELPVALKRLLNHNGAVLSIRQSGKPVLKIDDLPKKL